MKKNIVKHKVKLDILHVFEKYSFTPGEVLIILSEMSKGIVIGLLDLVDCPKCKILLEWDKDLKVYGCDSCLLSYTPEELGINYEETN